MKWFKVILLLGLLVAARGLAGDDDESERLQKIQELQSEIVVLTAKAQALQDTIRHFTEEATSDGELSDDELERIQKLTGDAEDLSTQLQEKISELKSLREDEAEDGEQIRSIAQLAELLDGAFSFVYVSAGKVDSRFAYYLVRLHPMLLMHNHFPRFAVVKYAEQYYPLVPGVAVLTSNEGWPLRPPPPFMPAVFLERFGIDTSDPRWTAAIMQHYTPFPVVSLVKGEVPEPPIMFFDRIDVEYDVSYFNVTVKVAGQEVTIPIPWRIVPAIKYRIYTISTPLISTGQFDPEHSTYSYIENSQDARNKILGPFLDALYRSPPYGNY